MPELCKLAFCVVFEEMKLSTSSRHICSNDSIVVLHIDKPQYELTPTVPRLVEMLVYLFHF